MRCSVHDAEVVGHAEALTRENEDRFLVEKLLRKVQIVLDAVQDPRVDASLQIASVSSFKAKANIIRRRLTYHHIHGALRHDHVQAANLAQSSRGEGSVILQNVKVLLLERCEGLGFSAARNWRQQIGDRALKIDK